MAPNNKSLLFITGLIPFMHVMLIVGIIIRGFIQLDITIFLQLFFVVYLLPPLMWRLLSPMIPTKMGDTYLGAHTEEVNGWFVSYQFQQIFNALPLLEYFLKIVPGLYSAWLRLWGAQIGNDVSWKLQSRVIDRPFIHIGDRCVIGKNAELIAHNIKQNGDLYLLYLREITIGSDVSISLQSMIGPGVVIGNGAKIMDRALVLANTKILAGQVYQSIR